MTTNQNLADLRKTFTQKVKDWDVRGAFETAAAISKQTRTRDSQPLARMQIVRGYYLAVFGNLDAAQSQFQSALWSLPDNEFATSGYQLCLSKLHEDRQKRNRPGQVVIGLGTGQCGSSSLTELLRSQTGAHVTHEMPPRLSWQGEPDRLPVHAARFELLRDYYGLIGDCSHYWLPYADELAKQFEGIKFVILKRDREATVASFMKIKGIAGKAAKSAINHWIDHDGSHFQKNIWDDVYPKYGEKDLEKALALYWDDYYAQCDALARRYPGQSKLVATESLGEPDCQVDLLAFCGVEDAKTVAGLHLNADGSVEAGNALK